MEQETEKYYKFIPDKIMKKGLILSFYYTFLWIMTMFFLVIYFSRDFFDLMIYILLFFIPEIITYILYGILIIFKIKNKKIMQILKIFVYIFSSIYFIFSGIVMLLIFVIMMFLLIFF